MTKRKHRRTGEARGPKTDVSPKDLRRAEAKIRAAFRMLDNPKLEEVRVEREGGWVVLHLSLEHKLDLGRGPGVEHHLTESTSWGVHLAALLAMTEEALARGFAREVSEGGSLAPDLSDLGFVDVLMGMMMAGLPQGAPRG